MKKKFLLDENILYEAIKGVDLHGRPDPTSTDLVRLIRENCHSIVLDRELAGRYLHHLSRLQEEPVRKMEPLDFLKEFVLLNSAKRTWESTKGVAVPPEARIPKEDIHIVRLAMVSSALVVTSERELRDAINAFPAFGLSALAPNAAIAPASET